MEGLQDLDEERRRHSKVTVSSPGNQTKGHQRNQSQAPLLEASYSDVDEEDATQEEEKRKREVRLSVMIDAEASKTETEEPLYPGEPWKTAIAFLFQIGGMVTTTISLIITNESVPDTKPLPDLVLDRVVYWSFGVKLSEWLMVFSILIAFTVCLLHSHRCILFRRIFFLLGLMYFYRALTMSVTTLPKPDPEWECPKHEELHNTSLTARDVWNKLSRIAMGGGISLGEEQKFCGDYIFSGHTMCLIMAYLVVRDYSPSDFRLLHWFSFLLFVCGISSLLAGRGHYTIDVILGYWVITRVWAAYHSLTRSPRDPHLASLWWWRVFMFLEGSVPPGPLPSSYSLPLPVKFRRRLASILPRWS